MSGLERRIERIEDKLVVKKPHSIVQIVFFGDKDKLPPERTEGGRTTKYVHYTDRSQQNETERNNKPKCS